MVPAEIWALLAGLALLTFALAGSSWAAARKARRLRRQREALLQEVGLLQEALLPAVPAGTAAVGRVPARERRDSGW